MGVVVERVRRVPKIITAGSGIRDFLLCLWAIFFFIGPILLLITAEPDGATPLKTGNLTMSSNSTSGPVNAANELWSSAPPARGGGDGGLVLYLFLVSVHPSSSSRLRISLLSDRLANLPRGGLSPVPVLAVFGMTGQPPSSDFNFG